MYLTQGLHRSVQLSPDRVATVFGERTRTFAEQQQRVGRLAGGLQQLGVVDGGRVGILALNSDRYAEALLAVPWANGVLNPVNTRWSPAEIEYSLRESGTRVLLVDDTFAPLVPALAASCELSAVVHIGEGAAPVGTVSGEELLAGAAAVPDARRGGDALAGIFYTGGTTGLPKGVMISHANLLVSALGSQATCPFVIAGGRLLHVAPMFHLADLAAWTAHSMLGGSHVFLSSFDPVAVFAAIEEHRVTNTLLVPAMIQALVDHDAVGRHDLSSVRVVVYGASPITESLLHRAMKAFPTADFVQAYGMTELAPVATMLSPDDHRDPKRARSAGRAAAHSEVRVVDEHDAVVPTGTVGEVVVRGGHVMLGYWDKPDETAAALRDGWMHTGDGGYIDEDGYLYIVDRLKDMVISGGENVYSAEVENAVAAHPAVAACAVIGVPDPTWGERVHAVVVLRPGAQLTLEELRAHTKELIAGYKAPRSVEFVEGLPVSAAGKVLKRELREPYWADIDRGVH